MKFFLIRSLITVGIILFQFNFLNLIFPNGYVVNIIPLAVVSWVIVAKFEKVWFWILLLGVMTDIVGVNKFGTNILFFITLAYFVSFLSKRFLIERRLYGVMIIILFITITSIFKDFNNILSFGNFNIELILSHIKNSLFLWENLFVEIMFSIAFFYLSYAIFRRTEGYLERCDNKLSNRL